jgi:hypothetical protein
MILTRNEIITRLEDRLAGRISAEALAAWAFDRFYAVEQGNEEPELDAAEPIADALDELMFADDESFALGDADLRRLIALLTPL